MLRRLLTALATCLVLTPGCRCKAPSPPTPPAKREVIDFHTHIALGAGAVADEVFEKSGILLAGRFCGRPFGPRLLAAIEESKAMRTPVVVFAGVPWSLVDESDFGELAAEDLRRSVAAGARGLKLFKSLGLGVRTADGALLPVDDRRLDPLWATAGELGIPVAIHTGDPVAFFEPIDLHNERLEELSAHPGWSFHGGDYPPLRELLAARDRMVARHPGTTFVSVHVGGLAEDLTGVAESLRALPNLYIDVAARIPEVGRHPPDRARAFFIEFQDRILFGTDIHISTRRIVLGSSGGPEEPRHGVAAAVGYYDVHWRYFESEDQGMAHVTPIQGRWTIDAIGLPGPVLAKLYRENARRLLGRE